MEFIKLDEDFLVDRKISALRRKAGYEGVGLYLSILSLIRRYKESSYQIPLSDIPVICQESLFISEERFMEMLDLMVETGLLRMSDKCFWSDRRRNDLLCQERVRKAQSEGGKSAMQRRWNSYKS